MYIKQRKKNTGRCGSFRRGRRKNCSRRSRRRGQHRNVGDSQVSNELVRQEDPPHPPQHAVPRHQTPPGQPESCQADKPFAGSQHASQRRPVRQCERGRPPAEDAVRQSGRQNEGDAKGRRGPFRVQAHFRGDHRQGEARGAVDPRKLPEDRGERLSAARGEHELRIQDQGSNLRV